MIRTRVSICSVAVFFALACALLALPAYADGGDLAAGAIGDSQPAGDVETYRMYNPYNGDHHYTQNAGERDFLKRIGWNYEGVGWKSPKTSGTPLHRMYNPYSGEHHYTMGESERDFLKSIGWNYEGVAWYSDDEKGVPLYRLFNPYATIGTHHYTASERERDFLKSIGWNYEGIAWYGSSLDSAYQDKVDNWSSSISGDGELDIQLSRVLVSHRTLRSAYDYVVGFSYRSGNKFYSNPHVLDNGTTIAYAKEMLAYGSGNCYRFASLFCWLARGLGYNANVISGWVPSYSGGAAPHGWVEVYIDGKTYICDPDLAHEIPGTNWYMRTYDNPPTTYGSW